MHRIFDLTEIRHIKASWQEMLIYLCITSNPYHNKQSFRIISICIELSFKHLKVCDWKWAFEFQARNFLWHLLHFSRNVKTILHPWKSSGGKKRNGFSLQRVFFSSMCFHAYFFHSAARDTLRAKTYHICTRSLVINCSFPSRKQCNESIFCGGKKISVSYLKCMAGKCLSPSSWGANWTYGKNCCYIL